jgi:hypothetical protein
MPMSAASITHGAITLSCKQASQKSQLAYNHTVEKRTFSLWTSLFAQMLKWGELRTFSWHFARKVHLHYGNLSSENSISCIPDQPGTKRLKNIKKNLCVNQTVEPKVQNNPRFDFHHLEQMINSKCGRSHIPWSKSVKERSSHCIYHNAHACTDLLHCTLDQVLCEGPLTLEHKLGGFLRPHWVLYKD